MRDLTQDLSSQIDEIERILPALRHQISKAPQGSLRVEHRDNKRTYYSRRYHDELGKYRLEYLGKNKEKIVSSLACKGYYESLIDALEDELAALKEMQSQYRPQEKYDAYDNLTAERKHMIKPVFQTVPEIVNQWKTEEWTPSGSFPEHLRFTTNAGEKVRSKSECTIANAMYSRRKRILYRYECPLILSNTLIHPDFTILDLLTGRRRYWEHAGRLDDERYADEFTKRINLYEQNGIFPGEDLIITYETHTYPLDISAVNCILDHYCCAPLSLTYN